jgi:CHAD domain-containing protein
MQPRFDPSALGTYLDQHVAGLRTHLPRAIASFDVTAVHQSRVATRRIKAALELLRSAPLERFARSTRDVRRLLGPLRDADVMIQHLNELDPSSECAAGMAFVHDLLDLEKRRGREKLQRTLDHARAQAMLASWATLRPEVDLAARRSGARVDEQLGSLLQTFSAGAGKVARRVHVDVHQVRIDGKALRYTLEIAELGGLRVAPDLAKAFKQMQEHLGLWHDFAALAHLAISASARHELSLHRPTVQQSAARLVVELIDRSEAELDGFRTLWRKRGAGVGRAIRGLRTGRGRRR